MNKASGGKGSSDVVVKKENFIRKKYTKIARKQNEKEHNNVPHRCVK